MIRRLRLSVLCLEAACIWLFCCLCVLASGHVFRNVRGLSFRVARVL